MPQRQGAADARRGMLFLTPWFSQWDHTKHKYSDARWREVKNRETAQLRHISKLYGKRVEPLCNDLGPREG